MDRPNASTRTDADEAAVRPRTARYRYNAFISYSHALDGKLAPAIEHGLKRFAKPVFQLRALEVFRDNAALSANPGLWSSIETALQASEHLILMASPEAAQSPWVAREVDTWCRTKSADAILIVLTDGEISWDSGGADFDWDNTTALPDRLRGVFGEEPRWIDLRWARPGGDISLSNPRFHDAITDLAAPLHHRRKDEIVGEDVAQHRRLRLLTRSAVATLVALVIALATSLLFALTQRNNAEIQARLAKEQQTIAEQQRDEALRTQSLFLADLSNQRVNAGDSVTGTLLALRALPNQGDRPYVAQAENALRRAESALRERAVLRGKETNAYSVALSRDGAMIAAGMDTTVQLWNAHSGQPIRTVGTHEQQVDDVAFSPDGRRLASASQDATVRVWDTKTGALLSTLSGHEGTVWSVAYSKDGTRIVSGAADGTVRVWDAATSSPVATLTGHQHWVRSVAFSDDASRVLSASNDGTVRLWDARSGDLLSTLEVSDEWVLAAAFSSDETRIASGSADNTVRLWDAGSGKLLRTFPGHSQPVASLAFSSDDKWLATGSFDGTIRVWKPDTGAPVGTLRGHESWVSSVLFSHDDSRIVSASTDGTVRLWSTQRVPSIVTLAGHRMPVSSASFSHDDRLIASGSRDGTIRIWDWRSGRTVRLLEGYGDSVSSVAFSRDGERIASASKDRTLRIWDAATGETLLTLTGHDEEISSVAFSPDLDHLVSAADDGTVRIWNARSGALLRTIEAHDGEVWSAAFSNDGKRVVSASRDGTVRIWDASSGASLTTIEADKDGAAFAAFSPDDTRVVVSSGFSASVWDIKSSKPLLTKRLDGPAHTALFSPDGRRVVSASAFGNVRVWDAETGEDHVNLRWGSRNSAELAPGIPGLVDPVGFSTFSHDGNWVAFLPNDNTVRLWFVGRTLEDLIAHAKSKLTRCLTADQEKQFFLRALDDDTPIDREHCKQ